jgi:hypothetical protein
MLDVKIIAHKMGWPGDWIGAFYELGQLLIGKHRILIRSFD